MSVPAVRIPTSDICDCLGGEGTVMNGCLFRCLRAPPPPILVRERHSTPIPPPTHPHFNPAPRVCARWSCAWTTCSRTICTTTSTRCDKTCCSRSTTHSTRPAAPCRKCRSRQEWGGVVLVVGAGSCSLYGGSSATVTKLQSDRWSVAAFQLPSDHWGHQALR